MPISLPGGEVLRASLMPLATAGRRSFDAGLRLPSHFLLVVFRAARRRFRLYAMQSRASERARREAPALYAP